MRVDSPSIGMAGPAVCSSIPSSGIWFAAAVWAQLFLVSDQHNGFLNCLTASAAPLSTAKRVVSAEGVHDDLHCPTPST
jgi:hypothetical protein